MSESLNQVTLSLELIVTFLGVFLAFTLDRLIDYRKEQQAKKDLLKGLSCELKGLEKRLMTPTYRRFYTNVWDSAVASGQLRLLNTKQLDILTGVYRKIKETDYEARRVRDAEEAYHQTGSNDACVNYDNLTKYQKIRTEKARERIEKALKEPWLQFE